MTEAEQLQQLRDAIFAIVESLGAALPMTSDVRRTLQALAEQ